MNKSAKHDRHETETVTGKTTIAILIAGAAADSFSIDLRAMLSAIESGEMLTA